ncbi:MAG TPA: aminopeptidase [Candidatus Blautia intestinigallinarum]|nr:aminopeptidase [Candidatus Blautia intestinigallinarum]
MEELLRERFQLSCERIREIPGEELVPEPYRSFFQRGAEFLILASSQLEEKKKVHSLSWWKEMNHRIYEELLPENYGQSYANPAYAVEKLGEYGKLLSFLYAEMRGAVIYAYEEKIWDLTVIQELFLEIYSSFGEDPLPKPEEIRDTLYWYVSDYCQDFMEERILENIDPDRAFALHFIMDSDFSDLTYLYQYGDYISENELKTAEFLNTFSQEEIEQMARTYTEGYRMAFVNTGKDLSIKETVNIRYPIGFERMVRAAVCQFEQMGLKPTIYRYATHLIQMTGGRNGFGSTNVNPQFEYDHKEDAALFLDHDFVQRKLRSMQNIYQEHQELAAKHAGPAVIEVFGEAPFAPETKKEVFTLSEEQRKLKVSMDNESAQITNRYIRGEERSFTIIAYPLPEIGKDFEAIFRETVKINNLDSQKYSKIQQKLIDTMDTCEWVEIKGANENETDLLIHLHELGNSDKQTNFENCVADCNIPVGEVFTSPVLAGTGGVLHVSQVYLNGLLFKELKLVFDCGQVIDYSCENFESEEENRKYIEDNILHHHRKIPMGEFAIGTNTAAYVMAKKYGIQDKLPILIAEKMGPHFAVGDTCYSWAEDIPVYNPDGKEIIARDNEISILRKEDISLAYYNCHTDITIPYEELGSIRVIDDDGEMISIIEEGRFVLPGTQELNQPLDESGFLR